MVATPDQAEQKRPRARREQGRAGKVEVVVATSLSLRNRNRDHGHGDEADGHVDVERPAPAGLVDEDPAERRADERPKDEGRPEQPLIAAARARRDDHADRRVREREQPSRAHPLDDAEGDELVHRLREAAQRRAEEEDRDRNEPEEPPPVDVAELPVQRHGDGHREDV